jgi:hypothetical protein
VLRYRDEFFLGVMGWTVDPGDHLRLTTSSEVPTFRNVLDKHAYHAAAFLGSTLVMGHSIIPEVDSMFRLEHYSGGQRVPEDLRDGACEACFWFRRRPIPGLSENFIAWEGHALRARGFRRVLTTAEPELASRYQANFKMRLVHGMDPFRFPGASVPVLVLWAELPGGDRLPAAA